MLKYLRQLGLVLLFAAALPLLDYSGQDVTVAYPAEVLLPLGMYLLTAVVIYTLAFFVLKTLWARVVASMVLAYVLLEQFPWLTQTTTPVFHYLPLPSLVLVVALIAVVLGVFRLLEWLMAKYLSGHQKTLEGLVIGICVVVFGYNSWAFANVWIHNSRAMAYQPTNQFQNLSLKQSTNPDIYYLVFDDYDSGRSLKDYLGYDNSKFTDFLKQAGFSVRDDANSNYQVTAPSVASTLQMGYLNNVGSQLASDRTPSFIPYQSILRNAPVDDLLRKAGYDTNLLGSWWNVTRYQNNAKSILPEFTATIWGHSFILSELQSNALHRSFGLWFLKHGLKIGGLTVAQANEADPKTMALDQAKALSDMASAHHARPQFVFAHILNPHAPFVFTKTGGEPDYDEATNNNDLPEKQKYTNQLEYINGVIEQLVSTIKAKSAKPPVIIIQSDEGEAFVGQQGFGPEGTVDGNKSKYGTLAAYYLPDTTPEQSAKLDSPVNAFRFVFNQYFRANLSYLPDCSYFYNGATAPFVYQDITSKLHKASPDCKQYVK